MLIPKDNKCYGFTLLEFGLAAGLLALLIFGFATRVHFYNGEAERVVAEQLIGTVRTALQVRSAQALASRGAPALNALLDENPLDWLSEKPENYLGEFYAPATDDLPDGNWYFDRSDKTLNYLPTGHKSFSLGTSKFLKFKVKLLFLPNPPGPHGRSKVTQGVVLDQVIDRPAVNTN